MCACDAREHSVLEAFPKGADQKVLDVTRHGFPPLTDRLFPEVSFPSGFFFILFSFVVVAVLSVLHHYCRKRHIYEIEKGKEDSKFLNVVTIF